MRVLDETIAFLRRSLEAGPGSVDVVTTHASMVFIGPERVLKLKRPVHYPYLDFSTPQKRLAACRNEYELNRRTAPKLYLGARTIARDGSGALVFDRPGELIDAVVEMRRFEQTDLFDAMARRGALTRPLISGLATQIAKLHGEAPVRKDRRGAARVRAVLDINDRSLRASNLTSPEHCDALLQKFEQAFEKNTRLLDVRAEAGKTRRCHGDLTLRNICLYEGEPTLFDCLEFDEELATIDVLYDLSFLLMDLWHRGQRELANWCVNRYLDARDETDGLSLAPFFMAMRACVRAHVGAAQARDKSNAREALFAEAREYLALAAACLTASSPRLTAVGGLSGSGKSTLAASLACEIGAAPGARVLSSDRIRKRLHGVEATARLPARAYRPETSQRVYAALRNESEAVIRAGSSCVVEAVFDRTDERQAIEAVASRLRIPFTGLWLDTPAAIAGARIQTRRNDPSDATVDVLRQQTEKDCGAIAWTRIDASGGAEETLDLARGIAVISS